MTDNSSARVLFCDVYGCDCVRLFIQATYFMPSVNCLSPRGKLYSKVCNIICKKRELGGKVKKSTDIGISAENLAASESLEEGYTTCVLYLAVPAFVSAFSLVFSPRHLYYRGH